MGIINYWLLNNRVAGFCLNQGLPDFGIFDFADISGHLRTFGVWGVGLTQGRKDAKAQGVLGFADICGSGGFCLNRDLLD